MHASHSAEVTSRTPPPLATRTRGTPGFADRVGRTPLISLSALCSEREGPGSLWGKAEFLNPTGSVKDRPALAIVRDALKQGDLSASRGLVDATSGNTGVAYAALGAEFGFPVKLFVPKSARPDRLRQIQDWGADVVLTDPIEGTDGAQAEARRFVDSHSPEWFYADQYNHPANPRAHFETTGPEIWQQTRHQVSHLVAGVGTGGTVSGTGRFLKSVEPSVVVVGVQPATPLHGIEGLKHIPTARRPGTYDESVVDRTIHVTTEDAHAVTDRVADIVGLRLGHSSGAAVHAALTVLVGTPQANLVVILPDGGPGFGAPSEVGLS